MINDPKLEILTISDLSVDGYVQRTYNSGHSDDLAAKWDPQKVGVFKVSRREAGGLWVLDGQHRMSAMVKLGKQDEGIFALVYEGLTKPEEAKIFLRDNVENRKPNTVDIFRIEVAAEVPEAVEINEVLRSHGLHVSMAGDRHAISAVGALRWLYKLKGTAAIDRTLSLVSDAWGPDVRSARDGDLLKGIGHVLINSTGGRLDVSAMAHKLGSAGKPSQLMGTARTYKQATGQSLWREVANVVVAQYNKGRTTNRITI